MECFIAVSKHEEVMNVKGRSPERFTAFECFDTVIKHAEGVVEVVSQVNAIYNCANEHSCVNAGIVVF